MKNYRTLYPALLFVFASFLQSPAQEAFRVGEVQTLPGEKRSGYIRVPAGTDCGEVLIPVTVVNGKEDGPVLALVAGIHGYEYPPVLAMARLAQETDPAGLSGKLIIVHIAHPPSFLKRTLYYNPWDWKNLNRVFPGKVDGTSSERIAYQLTREVVDRCDVLIDNHCGDGNEDLMQYLYCTETGNAALDARTKELAEAFNLKVIVKDGGRPKDPGASLYLSNTALLRGKPAISVEAGKLGRSDETDIQALVRGNRNIMKHLDMLEGEPEILYPSVWVQEYTILRSEQDAGMFFPLLSRGDHVEEGEMLGYLTDLFGNRTKEIFSPYSGIVLYIIATPPMSEGEPLVMIGKF